MSLPRPTGTLSGTAASSEQYIDSERLAAIERAVTSEVLRAHPSATTWSAMSDSAGAWHPDVAVSTPRSGALDVDVLSLIGTNAAGAIAEGLTTYLPVDGPQEYRVLIGARS
jgi:hypothetical protein